MAECPNCGASLDDGSRFCPRCGKPVERSTRVRGDPQEQTADDPVRATRTDARLYGVTPAGAALGLAAAALALAVVLFATGRWPIGLILVGLAVLLAIVSLEGARRRPAGAVSRSTTDALDGFRQRAGVAAEVFATRGRATRQLLPLRRELRRMAHLRERLLSELGDAVYRADELRTERARGQLEELDGLAAQREVEIQAVIAQARHRIERRRFETRSTEIAERPGEPSPGELDPPGPAVIPEPGPGPPQPTEEDSP